MQYFPIVEPFDDLRVVAVDRQRCELHIYLAGSVRGVVRLYYVELGDVLAALSGPKPIARLDLFEPFTHWMGDYKKNHVIGDDGTLHHVVDLP